MASFDYFHSNSAVLISQLDLSKLPAAAIVDDGKEEEEEGKEEEKEEEKVESKVEGKKKNVRQVRRKWRK